MSTPTPPQARETKRWPWKRSWREREGGENAPPPPPPLPPPPPPKVSPPAPLLSLLPLPLLL
jgi:hypothetical protein